MRPRAPAADECRTKAWHPSFKLGSMLSFVASDRHDTITSSMADIGGSVALLTDSSGNISRWQTAFRRGLPCSSSLTGSAAWSATTGLRQDRRP